MLETRACLKIPDSLHAVFFWYKKYIHRLSAVQNMSSVFTHNHYSASLIIKMPFNSFIWVELYLLCEASILERGFDLQVGPLIWSLIHDIMGQFLQGGKNGCFVSIFLFTESLRVAKPYKIELIFQLILVEWVWYIVKTSWLTLQNFFGVPCSTPILALLSNFWVKMR